MGKLFEPHKFADAARRLAETKSRPGDLPQNDFAKAKGEVVTLEPRILKVLRGLVFSHERKLNVELDESSDLFAQLSHVRTLARENRKPIMAHIPVYSPQYHESTFYTAKVKINATDRDLRTIGESYGNARTFVAFGFLGTPEGRRWMMLGLNNSISAMRRYQYKVGL